MKYTRQEIELSLAWLNSIKNRKDSDLGLKAQIAYSILQSFLDGEIGEYASEKEIENILISVEGQKKEYWIPIGIVTKALLHKLPKPQEMMGEDEIYKVVYAIERKTCAKEKCDNTCPAYPENKECPCGVRIRSIKLAHAIAERMK